MSQNYKIDFTTFCHAGDAHRLHAPGQLKRQVDSNKFDFDNIYIVYQECHPLDFIKSPKDWFSHAIIIYDTNETLVKYGIDINKSQYVSQDRAHHWKYHVVNHLVAINRSRADFIVFADNDCWMVRQPNRESWIDLGIRMLEYNPHIFIVSPNDGEKERATNRFSQQMFLARVNEFRNADFNQPRWDGNVNIPGGPMPEYWAMLEGRMELHCRVTAQYRYVLGPEYRYWHHRLLTKDDLFETDMSKY